MREKKKDYVNAIAKADIETFKSHFKILNYFFSFLFLALGIMAFVGSTAVAFFGLVFSGFYLLVIRPLWKSYLAKVDNNL